MHPSVNGQTSPPIYSTRQNGFNHFTNAPVSRAKIMSCETIPILRQIGIHFLSENFTPQHVHEFENFMYELKKSPLNEGEILLLLKFVLLGVEKNSTSFHLILDWAIYFINYNSTLFTCIFDLDSFYSQHKNSLSLLLKVCQGIHEIESYTEQLNSLLEFYLKTNSLGDFLKQITQKKEEIFRLHHPEKSLEVVFHEFSEENPHLFVSLKAEELSQLKNQYSKVMEYRALIVEKSPLEVKKLILEIKARAHAKKHTFEDKFCILAIAREELRRKFKIYPYNSQIIIVLALTLHNDPNLKGRIGQVKTGEGKSTITTLLLVLLAMSGECIDVITSSRYLAVRDHKKYYEFFDYFSITTSHICVDAPTKWNFSGQIMYGTNTDFEFSILRDNLNSKYERTHYKNQTLKRPCEIVIIDEVDNLFIDKANDSARITNSSVENMKWVYRFIFYFIKNNEDLVNSSSFLSQIFVHYKFRESLFQYEGGKYKDFLNTLSQKKLFTWFSSAKSALYTLKENKDYTIKCIKREDTGIYEKSIVIVDYRNTGRLNEGCRWQNGMHEFLEVKHNLTVGGETLMSASLSHPVFFGYYSKIYGLTGTLGGKDERDEMKMVYKIDTFDAPTYLPPKRKALTPLYCETKEIYLETIKKELELLQKERRPCLILCSDIAESENIFTYLLDCGFNPQLLNAVQNKKEDSIISQAGISGAITIATNTAGRGTDISLTKESINAGGLHVVFSFYPINVRVKDQGEGRAGRNGAPGTSRIIISPEDEFVQELLRSDSSIKLGTKSEMIFPLLAKYREEKLKESSTLRMVHVDIEKIHNKFLEEFFKNLASWHSKTKNEYLLDISKNPEKYKLKRKVFFRDVEKTQQYFSEKIMKIWSLFYSSLENIEHPLKNAPSNTDYQNLLLSYEETIKKEFHDTREELQNIFSNPIKVITEHLDEQSSLKEK